MVVVVQKAHAVDDDSIGSVDKDVASDMDSEKDVILPDSRNAATAEKSGESRENRLDYQTSPSIAGKDAYVNDTTSLDRLGVSSSRRGRHRVAANWHCSTSHLEPAVLMESRWMHLLLLNEDGCDVEYM